MRKELIQYRVVYTKKGDSRSYVATPEAYSRKQAVFLVKRCRHNFGKVLAVFQP